MDYQELAKNYLMKIKPEFSLKTFKSYSLRLKQLNEDLNDNLSFDENFPLFNDYNNIFNYISEFNTDKSLSFLHSIILILDYKNNKDLLKIYKSKREYYYKIKDEKRGNNYKSENFIDYDELLSMTDINNFDNMTLKEGIKKMMLYIVVRYPLRLELWDLPIIKNIKQMDDNKNYFYITSKKMEFFMNSFKNVKSFGKTRIEVELKDEKIIRKYLKFLTKNKIILTNLILNYYNKADKFNSIESYFRVLKKQLLKKFNKDITTNDIRHSYSSKLMNSDEYKIMTNNEKTELHSRLLHSPFSANQNYNKI